MLPHHPWRHAATRRRPWVRPESLALLARRRARPAGLACLLSLFPDPYEKVPVPVSTKIFVRAYCQTDSWTCARVSACPSPDKARHIATGVKMCGFLLARNVSALLLRT